MPGPGSSSIGGQVMGELKQLGKDVGQAVADVPGQILNQKSGVQESRSSGDKTGKTLEAGTATTQVSSDEQTGGSDPQQQQQTSSGQGWVDAFSAQVTGKQQTQQKIAQIRRNLEQEIQAERQKRQQKEQQQKQAEEQQAEQIKKQKEQQKKQMQKQAVAKASGGPGPGQFGKGETRGAKGS